MAQLNPEIDHLLRRAGFGASASDAETFKDMSPAQAVAYLVDYEGRPDDVDARMGRPDHAQLATEKADHLFAPDIDIDDARQRWMFRMIHTRRPLQEKMALFWHNHFATGYTKLANDSGMLQGAKMLAHKPGTLRGPQGQIELFRQYALGNFRNLLVEVARDPATLIWLDGQSNTRASPQENFGREIMELFTVGVGYYTEPDVYAAARVFSGWNLRPSAEYTKDDYGDMNGYQEFVYQSRPARDQRQDILVPDLQRRRPDDSGAQRVRGHAGRAGPDRRPGDAPGDGAANGAQALELLRQ